MCLIQGHHLWFLSTLKRQVLQEMSSFPSAVSFLLKIQNLLYTMWPETEPKRAELAFYAFAQILGRTYKLCGTS